MKELCVGTRFWGKNQEDLHRLGGFLSAALGVADTAYVAVNTHDDTSCSETFISREFGGQAQVLPVEPWGFAPALNTLFETAAIRFTHMLVASVEVPPSQSSACQLGELASRGYAYAGAVLPGHDFHEGQTIRKANALQVPWNTFSLVSLQDMLAHGVPSLVDSPEKPEMAGMEEVATLSIQQRATKNPSCLVRVASVSSWTNTAGWDAGRIKAHERKMETKLIRATYQLRKNKLRLPTVHHLFSQ